MSKLIDNLSAMAAISACVVLVAMVGMILFEIVLRSAFDSSTYVLDEFVGYGVAIMTFLSFAFTLRDGVFIRVGLVTSNLGPASRRILEVISCAVGTLIFSLVAYYILKLVMKNFSRGVVSNSLAEVPLWIPQGLVLIGMALLVLQFAAMTARYALGAPIIDNHNEL